MHKKKFLILIFIFLSGCASTLKNDVAKYQGDGSINYTSWSYLPFLKVEGYTISFPAIDLSKEYHERYKLSSLPPNKEIMLYFIVEEDGNDRALKNTKLTSRTCNGILSLKLIDSKSVIVWEFNKKINELTEYSIDNNWTWMHNGAKTSFTPISNEHYSLLLIYQPNGYHDNKKGYVYLKHGGTP